MAIDQDAECGNSGVEILVWVSHCLFDWQVFTLPKVSSKLKLKLTALDGCRVRKVSVASFASCKTDYTENNLAVLTNLGDLQIISLPSLKVQVRYPCIRKEDVSGIASCVFTRYGQGNNVVIQ